MNSTAFSRSALPCFRRPPLLTLAGILALLPATGLACSICGCSLSSDWAQQGDTETEGFQASVRYEYFEQDNLRNGLHDADTGAFTYPNANEVQQKTYNRATWLGLDWNTGTAWDLSFQIPYIDRWHSTIDVGDTAISTSAAAGLGDARLTARYQIREGNESSWNLQFGLKLPTGGFGQNFATGPDAGTLLDRGLQLGTGTTDLLAGVGYFARPALSVSWFSQIQLQQPLAARADFLPASTVTLNNGVRWLNSGNFTPELQFNVRWDSHESGLLADYPNSGDLVALLTPGVTADLTHDIAAFAYVQVPVFQHVNGLQLEPRWLLTSGVRWRF